MFLRNLILFVLLCLLTVLYVFPQNAAVIAENANLRGTPRETGKIVETLPRGTPLEIIKQNGAWFLVQTSDFVGWLHGSTIKLIDDGAAQNDTESVPPTFPSDTPNRIRAAPQSVRRSAAARDYIRGPRGGCYYINGSGRKTYVDRSLCN